MQTTATEAPETLPHWNLYSLFPGPDSPELRTAVARFTSDSAELESLFDEHEIGRQPPGVVDDQAVAIVEEVLARYNALLDLAMRIDGYLYCLTAADVRDEAAQGAEGEWRQLRANLARLAPRFTAWAGALDADALAARSTVARGHLPVLRRLRVAAAHLMPPGEEDLAAALGPSGAAAWMTLRDDLAGRATARIELDGEERELPLSEIENLGYHSDRDVRRRAHDVEEAAWRDLGVPLAAALNGVKGQQLTLALRRGWGDPLDQALFLNAIDRPTLDALLAAISEALPDYRRALRAKARLLGLPVLAGYDLMAPVGEPALWPFERAQSFIIETFTAASPKLGTLAERAFAAGWIDAAPRVGKDGGAFCMAVGGDQSRIFCNYLPVYDQMSALAHELGHAYHTAVVAERGYTMLQAPSEMAEIPLAFPLTLGETASTLCEALVQRAARSEMPPAQEVAVLDGWLQAVSLNVFGTLPMFNAERAIFATRARRELSPHELEELMAASWHEVAGDAIDPGTVWKQQWVATHFYLDGIWYYNFPYAFGMLFGLGLLAFRDTNPEGFFNHFDDLLADSGMSEASELAARFGIDLRDPAFWRSALDLIRADIDLYESLATLLAPEPATS